MIKKFFSDLFSGAANKAWIGGVVPMITGFVLDWLKLLPGVTSDMTLKQFVSLLVAAIVNLLAVYAIRNR